MLNLSSIETKYCSWLGVVKYLSYHTGSLSSVVLHDILYNRCEKQFILGKYRELVADEKKSWFSCVKWAICYNRYGL